MAIGELFLAAFLQVLFDRLASRELSNFANRGGIRKKLKKWSETLSAIQAVLNDAEEKQLTDKAVKKWLDNLRDLAHDVEDILDEFATEALRHKLMAEGQASSSKLWNLAPAHFTRLSPSSIKFNLGIGSKIRKITGRLKNISEQITKLGLERLTWGTSAKLLQRPPSTSLPNETCIYGRDDDKEKILELLLRDEPSDVNFGVISIVGMGGVGKTTVAQLLYNDNAVKHFNPKVWISVSEDFDVFKITKTIVESITSLPCDLQDLNQVQVILKEALEGKRFLLVLDDVWNKNYGEWKALQPPFHAGAPGSKIIVTTRDSNVALMMGAVKYHYLEHISDDDCWSVFVQHAFENKDIAAHPNLELIGRKIVERCRGLPLAARTLGGLLRCKQREDEWEDMLNSKIWSLSAEESEILPVLRLSYHHLPSHLKRCFVYCSILPRDYEFEEKELVLLWMAEGLIHQPEEDKQMEDLGGEYFRELLARSFFQQSSKDKSKFVMHDLISDMAQWVAGDTGFKLEDKLYGNRVRKVSQKARHSSYICGEYDGAKKFEAFSDIKCLRTFLPLMPPYPGECYLTRCVPFHLLPKLKCLRVLSLCGYNIIKLPDSIGTLKHLRYLDFSHTNIRSLPESVSSLYNLETLKLKHCLHLQRLPSKIGNLINLRHLDITKVNLIKEMPLGISKLKSLQTLSDFVVGKDTKSGIAMLMNLKFLRGRLCISGLENVTDVRDVREACLRNKQGIDELLLKWESKIHASRNERVELDVLDELQPHGKLKELTIEYYGGSRFPSWVGNPSFSYMLLLRLEHCEKCTSLPPLGLLPSLKDLVIEGMAGVKSVGPEFYGEGELKPFRSLETLLFKNMQEWECWNPCGINCEEFPSLHKLFIQSCPKLLGQLPRNLPSLENLAIHGCEKLVASIPSLPMLCKLEIEGCEKMVHNGTVDFRSLKSMLVSNISQFTCLTEDFMRGSRKLEELKIVGCKELISLWQNEQGLLRWLTFLRQLVIEGCPQLVSLMAEEEGEQLQLGWVCQLESLELRHCERLEKLPNCLHNLISLTQLTIEDCPKLDSLPEAGLPYMLRVIRIINCKALAPLPEAVFYNSIYLEDLCIEGCDFLESFGRSQLPPSLKRLEIISCINFQCLLVEGETSSFSSTLVMHEDNVNNSSSSSSSSTSSLEYLYIEDCPSLSSLSSRGLPATLKYLHIHICSELISITSEGNLPVGLKHLEIWSCPKLESIAEEFAANMPLERVDIHSCDTLKYLPKSLHNLSHLREITIRNCQGLVSFPEGGLPTTKLRELSISRCEKLEALPDHLHNLASLQQLRISDCPSIESFPEEGFPTNLTSLVIRNLNICKPLFEWGLHKLNSLRRLYIEGGCPELVSFPQEEIGMMLPTSLTNLTIRNFPNLKYLSSTGFQNLTTLEELFFYQCPKLTYFPDNGLPPSLSQLYINRCPLLKQRCKKDTGKEWSKIAHIPRVEIDGMFIYDIEEEDEV